MALIGDPELIFLDEPTTGFDPSARRAAWEVIVGLSKLGKTVFLTTHYMEEAEYLADRVAVIAAGKIVAQGTPQTLGGRDRMTTEISFTVPDGVALTELPIGIGATHIESNGKVRVSTEDPVPALFSLTRWAVENDHQLPDLELHRATLEDVYLTLTDRR